jgi:hypothetical protein
MAQEFQIGDEQRELKDFLPQDVGLPVLQCANCWAELHTGHPCPECGFRP